MKQGVGGWSRASCITGMVWLVVWVDPSEAGTRFSLDWWGLKAAKNPNTSSAKDKRLKSSEMPVSLYCQIA